jgi:murein DD-endopeptidase MepM/ murein hydrolase activator NlpD
MRSLTSERRRLRRRRQIRRRRVAAVSLVFTLVVLAVAIAFAWPLRTPAPVPAAGAGASLAASDGTKRRVPLARVEAVDVLLPVAQRQTTAIAFHPVDNANTVPFAPVGERVDSPTLADKVADIFNGGGGPRYYQMAGDGSDSSSSTSGLDVGAVPGVAVYSPVDGHVTAVKPYALLGRYTDVEVDIQLTEDPSLLLVVTHLAKTRVKLGDVVRAGETELGRLRAFPSSVRQGIQQYTADAGDHVQLVVLRVTPNLAGF